MKNKLLFSILGVAVISAFTFGGTYAYYMASSEALLEGEIGSGLTSTLNSEEVYAATTLVPLSDSLVSTAISKSSNKCIDKSGYEVCSLYKLTLTNTDSSENLYGYVRTGTSTYTTDNLKYQVFDSSYNAVTDVMTVSNVADTTVYFLEDIDNSDDMYVTASNGSVVYYLAIWLHDTNDYQDDDYSKTFSGYVGFESVDYFGSGTGRIEAEL